MNLPASALEVALGVYLLGAVAGIAVIDARAPARVALALLWPLGPLAFLATVSILLLASLVAFPAVGLAAAVAILLAFAVLA